MNLIEQLAALVGFHASYTDSFGKEVYAKDEARRLLLNAMGYKLDDENTLQQQIRTLEEKSWRNLLPPVHIAKLEEAQHSIKISLRQGDADSLRWQISTESGEVHQESVKLDELCQLEQASFDGDAVPVRHFGVILPWDAWEALAQRIAAHGVAFRIAPRVRFEGEPGEQGTFFVDAPSGHALEFKAFRSDASVFATD